MKPLLIIGTGLAGYTLAREFRKLDSETPLTIITADDGRAYSKPMLSNALAKGKTAETLAMANAEKMARDLTARILTLTEVAVLDIKNRTVVCGQDVYPFANLVLALGANPIQLPIPGDGADQVLHVNNLADYGRFRNALTGKKHVVIMGPGLIGCEFANDLIQSGFDVSVIGPDEAPISQIMPLEAGRALQQALTAEGVNWHLGPVAERIDRHGQQLKLLLSDGKEVIADVVLSAIGLRPAIGLARDAGLEVNRGIVVNRQLQASAEGIYALGDCAEVSGMVLPFVTPIMHAARALAKTLSGSPTEVVYPAMPVVVKTPAHPVVIASPPPTAQGQWQIERTDAGVRARYMGDSGELLGFVLTGNAVKDKQALTKLLPPLLD